jgi:chemotaxis protein CheD
MMAAMEGLFNVYLKPGELHITDKPTVISTVLGSCVSVAMYSTRFGIGGMCHALLPGNGDGLSGGSEAFRYVDKSIIFMAMKFAQLGIKRHEISVKLFGGADVLYYIKDENRKKTIGKMNIEKAIEILTQEQLVPISTDVGGTSGRKIFFHTKTGEIFLKRLTREGVRDFS